MSVNTDLERATRGLEPALAAELRRLARLSGIGNGQDQATAYVARRMAWHVGAAPMPTTAPSSLRGSATRTAIRGMAERRAWELVTEHHRRLPPIDWRTGRTFESAA